MKIHKGDKVQILLGKDRGKTGEVKLVLGKNQRVFVEGVNLYKRHVRKMEGIEGGIIDLPKSMNISNVILVCPKCNKPTRVGYKLSLSSKEGKPTSKDKVRICKKCGKEIVYAKA